LYEGFTRYFINFNSGDDQRWAIGKTLPIGRIHDSYVYGGKKVLKKNKFESKEWKTFYSPCAKLMETVRQDS